jgi:hypothetical protein
VKISAVSLPARFAKRSEAIESVAEVLQRHAVRLRRIVSASKIILFLDPETPQQSAANLPAIQSTLAGGLNPRLLVRLLPTCREKAD